MIGMIQVETSIAIALITLVSAPIAAIVAWILNKRKQRTDLAGTIALASGEAVDAIRDVMTSLREELKETKHELEQFKLQNKELESSLKALHEQNKVLLEQNGLLAREIAQLKKQVDRFAQYDSQQSDS